MIFQVMSPVGEGILKHLPAHVIKTLFKREKKGRKGMGESLRRVESGGGLWFDISYLSIFSKCQ